jgi:alkylation response protein AidB-like acyl-CoA dehydrogenase
MDLTLTEDQRLIQGAAAELLEERAATCGVKALEDDPVGWSAGLWKQLVELGWPGLALPEDSGGLGAGFLEVCLLIEQMGRFQVPSPLLSTVACCALPIARFGTAEQRAEWLGAIGRGRVMAYARGAPRGRWGAAGADVVATATDDGYVLDGTAMFVPYARGAEALLTVARGPSGPAGPAVFLVDAAAPGIACEPLAAVGTDRLYRVGFERVAVPAGRVLGGRWTPAGRSMIETINAYGAAATCAEMVGGAQRVLDMTVEYAGAREQFGRPVGGFQAVQHHCANMAMDVLTARFIAYEAIWRLAEGQDAALEVSMAKAWVSEAYQRVCAAGHQVHGAIGFTREHDLQVYSRHATATELSFGDGDFHWAAIADRLDLPKT